MELLKIVDDVLTYVNSKLQKLEKLRQELKEKVDDPLEKAFGRRRIPMHPPVQ